MSLTLGTLFDRTLHRAPWADYGRARQGSEDYRVTNPFDGVDLINGGRHSAVDVGDGTGRPQPLLSPINGRARGLHHFDGALGIEFDLGNGWSLQAWHLSATLPVAQVRGASAIGGWYRVRRLSRAGATGNTGPAGLPFHTHLELRDPAGRRVDPEPHLFGRPIEGASDDMAIFTDTAGSPHEADIEALARTGIAAVGGTRRFDPKGATTREQMASYLVRALRQVEEATGVKILR